MYEMLVGYPPFFSDISDKDTYDKIRNFKDNLRFPDYNNLSKNAKDLIGRLLTDQHNRIGAKDVEEIKLHPFFKGIDWVNLRNGKGPFAPDLKSNLLEIHNHWEPEGDSDEETVAPKIQKCSSLDKGIIPSSDKSQIQKCVSSSDKYPIQKNRHLI